jgi:lipoate-protein ligase A
MPAIHVARIPRCDPARFARIEAGLLRHGWPKPLLVLAGIAEPAVLLGRHQRARSAVDVERAHARGLPLVRRAGGGRSLVVGEGVLGVFLYVPPADPLAAPGTPAERLLNRHVRGLLAGLRGAGARSAAYFGRDFVSAEGRQLALVSQETTAGGGAAFEALVAASRPLPVPHDLTRYPPHRDPRAGGPRPVSLAELSGRAPAFEELATAIEQGYSAAHEREPVRAAGLLPEAELPAAAEDEEGFAESGLVEVPIGFAEALVRHEAGRVVRARLRGDFVAPAFVVAGLEADLDGAPLAFAELGRRVDAAFRRPGAFVHGVRELRVLADAVLAAAGAGGANAASR